ncbi:MAG: cation:proton antiporter [Patescibacteria group bacterium]|jgi:Kef-type K+ transport system membrane component KefB
MSDTLFIELAIVVMSAGLISLLVYLLRQPLIIAYVLTGLIIGPSILVISGNATIFEAFADIGVAFLLFLVGLNLNWRNLRDIGPLAMVAGLGQILLTSTVGFFILRLFDFDLSTSILGGLALSFSSTIVIVKLLSDQKDIDRLHGRLAVGILIVQDIVAMLVLLVIGTFGSTDQAIGPVLLISGLKAVASIVVLLVIARYILPPVFRYAAKSQELLFLASLSWCFAVAVALQWLGFSIEMGALLAGISLAGSEYHHEIISKVKPLRDFFLILFFIILGASLSGETIGGNWWLLVVLLIIVLKIKPAILIGVLRLLGIHPRTGFLTASALAQMSEFSFILGTVSVEVGLMDEKLLPIFIMAGIGSIGISTYFIKYGEPLYDRFRFGFRWMEPRGNPKEIEERAPEILLFGCDTMGEALLPSVRSLKKEYLVVDFNPAIIKGLKDRHIPFRYGDIGNEDFLDDIHASHASIIISTIPDRVLNSDVLAYLRAKRSRVTAIVSAKNMAEAKDLYKLGAAYVMIPGELGGVHAGEMLKLRKDRKASWQIAARKQKKLLSMYE